MQLAPPAQWARTRRLKCTALELKQRSWHAQVNSEFQAFKHVEILGPGEHMRAQQPLEATLAIHPTVVLTNALPYPMHLILWQVCSVCCMLCCCPGTAVCCGATLELIW
jgi:hypothetical protein